MRRTRRGCPRVVSQSFRSNPSMVATRHVYDMFGEIATDYYDLVRVSSTLV